MTECPICGRDPCDSPSFCKAMREADTQPLAQILDDVHAFLGHFVIYPSKEAHDAHVLWIAHTHLMDAWESTPRIAFLSPEPASGKSRALEVSELLVPNAVEAVNVTPAYLFRKVGNDGAKPTILFDEIDTVFGPKAKENEEIRGLLNAGHRRGAVAGRCVMRGNTAIAEDIPAYCAVALAGLGWLPDTILSRSIVVRMRPRLPSERVTPFRRRVYAKEGQALQGRLATWATGAVKAMTDARPEMPQGIEDRDADLWEAPFAIADAAGEDWAKRARGAAVTLVAAAAEREPSLGIRLLSDLRDIFGDALQLTTAAILDALKSLPEAPWNDLKGKPLNERGLAHRLRQYSVKSKTLNLGGESRAKGYSREDLWDAWERYLPPSTLSPTRSVTSVTSVPQPNFTEEKVTDGADTERSVTDEWGEKNADEIYSVTDGTDVTDMAGNGDAADTDTVPGWQTVNGESLVCAQCDDPSEPIWICSTAEGPVPLHRECLKFWVLRHPQPTGGGICCVHINGRPRSTLGPRDDDIQDINLEWRR